MKTVIILLLMSIIGLGVACHYYTPEQIATYLNAVNGVEFTHNENPCDDYAPAGVSPEVWHTICKPEKMK
jgi:hypothetical protein